MKETLLVLIIMVICKSNENTDLTKKAIVYYLKIPLDLTDLMRGSCFANYCYTGIARF